MPTLICPSPLEVMNLVMSPRNLAVCTDMVRSNLATLDSIFPKKVTQISRERFLKGLKRHSLITIYLCWRETGSLHDAVVQDGGRVSVLPSAALSVGPLQVEAVGAVAGDGLAHLVNVG